MIIENIKNKIKVAITSKFGKEPNSDVGYILTEVQKTQISGDNLMKIVQKIYMELCQEIRGMTENQARNSWTTASGNNFEGFIREFINKKLNKEGIVAIKGDELKKSIFKNKNITELVEFITLRAHRRCVQENTGVWPDSDILLITKNSLNKFKVFSLLNCKTSDHSRNTAVMFWALALRDLGIKYALVTQDLDNRYTKGHDRPSMIRRLSEAYLDAVFSTNPETSECSQVIKLDFTTQNGASILVEMLKDWRKAIISDYLDAHLDSGSLI